MRATSPAAIRWKRPRTEVTVAARRRVWESRCGRFRVIRSHCRYGPRKGPKAIVDRFYALRLEQIAGRGKPGVWTIISIHRVRHRAMQACEEACKKDTYGSLALPTRGEE